MKLRSILALLILINISLQAQSIRYTAKQTEEFKQKGMTKKSFSYLFLGQDDKYIYYDFLPRFETYGFSQGYTSAHYLCKLSKDMKTTTKQIIDFGKEVNPNVKKLLYINDNIYAALQTSDGLKLFKINKKTYAISDHPILLIPDKSTKSFHDNFIFRMSEDKKLLMIFYYIKGADQKPKRFGISVFDTDFELVWNTEDIHPEFEGESFSFVDFKVNNDGEVYFLSSISSGEDKSFYTLHGVFYLLSYNIDEPGKYYQLYHVSNDGEDIEQTDITIGDNYKIRDMNFEANNKDITIYGVYCDEEMVSALGVFIGKFDFEKSKIQSLETKEFKKDLIIRDYTKKEKDFFNKQYPSSEWDAYHYDISDLKTRKDGSQYFVAEQWIRGRYSDNNISMTSYIFHDLYVTSFDDDFEIQRLGKISKLQFTPIYTDRCSYSSIEGDNGTYFIFNNFPKLQTPMLKDGTTLLLRLSANGEQERQVIGKDFSNLTPVILPPTFAKVGETEFVIGRASIEPKKYAFLRIKIEE